MTEQEQVVTMNVALPIDAWNVVIEALAGMSYVKVYQLVASIHQQIQQQQVPAPYPDELTDVEEVALDE